MCVPRLRALLFTVLPVMYLTARPAPAAAQPLPPKGAIVVIEPEIRTRIEGALTLAGDVMTADYYKIDMRFGPGLRIDAVVVTPGDAPRPVKGLRVQVRDEANPDRHFAESFLDLDEAEKLTQSIAKITRLAEAWTGYDDRRASEVSFTSAGGFRLAVNAFGRMQRVQISTGLRDRVATSIEIADLVSLKQAIDQALAILHGK
jgi:hypothetical protein